MHGGDLTHQRAGDVAHVRRGRRENGVHVRRHRAVHASHLHFIIKVRPVAQAAQQNAGPVGAGGVDSQPVKRHDLDLAMAAVSYVRGGCVNQCDLLVQREQRLLARMGADADDEP